MSPLGHEWWYFWTGDLFGRELTNRDEYSSGILSRGGGIGLKQDNQIPELRSVHSEYSKIKNDSIIVILRQRDVLIEIRFCNVQVGFVLETLSK